MVARLLGGRAYWPYGVERLAETCRERGIPLALLPGDDKPDPELARLSTLPPDACRGCGAISREGGPGNADDFLRYAAQPDRLRETDLGASRRRCCAPGSIGPVRATPSLADIAAEWRGEGGVVPIVFYRALVQSGNTAPVDALVEALAARGLRPLPVFVTSLKDAEAAALLRRHPRARSRPT